MSPPATHPLGPRLLAAGVATLLLSWAAPAAGQTPDPTTSEVTTAPASVPADGATTSTITVTLRDSVGTQIPTGGDTVELATTLGVLSPVTDNTDGTYTATITSLDGGTATVSARVNGNPISDDATVEFTAIALRFDVQPSAAEVNATIAPPVRVEAIDGAGNRVTSFAGTVLIAIQDDPSGGSATLGGTTSDIANNGVAVFNNLSIDEVGDGYTLQATSSPLAPVTSDPFNITTAAATELRFDVQPSNTQVGATITPAVTVRATDGTGTTDTGYSGTITVAILNNPGGGNLSGTLSQPAVNGVATFSNLSIDAVGTGYTLQATSVPALTPDTSDAFNITSVPATELRFGVQPSNTQVGGTITPAVTVRATDGAGTTDAGYSGTITVAILNNPGGGTLSGTLSQPAVNGVATFNNLSIDAIGNGYTLQATSVPVLTPDTSDGFNITSIPASELRFGVQPSNTQVGATISPPVTVRATDAAGTTDTGFSGTITVAIQNNPGGGTLSGTLSQPAVNGVATFSNLSIDAVGNGYTLQATSVPALTPDTSNGFNITAAPATELRFGVQPSDTQVRQTIAPPITVRATDSTGTTDPNFIGTITVAILNNPGGGTLSGTLTRTAVNGVATFNNLSINQGGNGYTLQATSSPALTPGTSLGFDIFGPSTANSTITANPIRIPANGTSTSTITVQLIDTNGDPITTGGDLVNLFATDGTMSANPATDNGNGTYTGTLTSGTSIANATISGTVNALGNIVDTATVRFGATRLIFFVGPTDTNAQATITPAIRVRAVDGPGTLDGTFTGSVTVAIGNNPGGGTLFGSTTVSAVGGEAVFSNLSIDAVGNGYTLTANSIGLTGATSSSFNITLPPAVALEFVQQPTDTAAGASISPVTVRAVNGLGDTDTNFTGTVTITIQNNPGGGILSGTTSIGAVNGVATFSNLSIDVAANGYTLQATGGGLTPDTSDPFDINPGPPSGATSEITAVPPDITADGISTATVTVRLRDALGNDLTSGGDPVNLFTTAGTLTANPATDVGNGTYTATLTSSTTAGTATITGTVNGNPIADDATVNFLPGGAGALEFVQQPTTTASGSTISPAVTVRAVDANMNTDTSFNGNITLTIGTNPSGGTLSGTTTVAAVSGVATFSNLSIDLAGAGYTLIAQAAGLGGDESTPFDIVPGPPSGTTSIISANPTAIPADGASTSTITVQLFDAAGNPLTSGGDTVALSTNGGSLGSVLDNGNGTYTATLTASTTPQTATITGTVNATPIADTAAVAFVIGSADRLEIVQQPSTTPASAQFVPRISVRVVDANGNTVPSFTGPISAAIATNPSGGSLIGTTTVNAVGGTATFTSLAINQAGSGYTLVFSAAGFTPVTSIPFTITAGGASGATSTITANPTSIPADGTSTSTITVQLKDASGSNLTSGGDAVTLSTTAGTLSSVTDNNDGTYTATLTSSAASGTATITGTVNGGSIAASATVTFSQVAAGTADLAITAAVSNPNPTIGSTVVYTITVINRGPDTATGVQVTDALPSRLSLVSAEASQGTFSVATGVWSIGELEVGASATLALTVNVGP